MRASQISSSGSAPQALTTASARGPWLALLEFPSAEAVKAFATDPKYAPYAAARQAGSESRFQLIDDTDVAGKNPFFRERRSDRKKTTPHKHARVGLSAAPSREIWEQAKTKKTFRSGGTKTLNTK